MLKHRKILIMSLLLVPLFIGYTQSDSDDEENPITDPVLLEKLKQGSLAIHRGKMNRGDASLSPRCVDIRPALEKQFNDFVLSR